MADNKTPVGDPKALAERDWITPAQAVAALAKIYGNRAIAKDALANSLLDGEVIALAD